MQNLVILDNQPMAIKFFNEFIEETFPKVFKLHACASVESFFNLSNDLNITLVISELKLYQQNSFEPEYTFEIIKTCKSKSIPCLIYSNSPNPNYISRCIQMGARGIILKISDLNHLATGIENLIKGEKYLCNNAKQNISFETMEKEKINQPIITKRQIEIFHLKFKGYSNIQISEQLNIEICSVRKHRKIAREKNDCNNDELIQRINFWHPTY